MKMQVFGSSFQVSVKCTKCKWFGKVSHPQHRAKRDLVSSHTAKGS